MVSSHRWRDVKLRAFEDADHRTYVDLKVNTPNTNLLIWNIYLVLDILSKTEKTETGPKFTKTQTVPIPLNQKTNRNRTENRKGSPEKNKNIQKY